MIINAVNNDDRNVTVTAPDDDDEELTY